jgi:hypothetical protein
VRAESRLDVRREVGITFGSYFATTPAEALVFKDKLSRSEGYRSSLQNGPKTKVLVQAESRFSARGEVGRDDADQERSQNRPAAIRRLSLDRPILT